MGVFVGPNDVYDVLSADVARRIFDDDRDGTPDPGPMEALIASVEARVKGACRDIYSLSSLTSVKPDFIVTLCRLGIQAECAMRFPKAYGREWQPLMAAFKADLKALRNGEIALDVEGLPEPAANKGGEVGSYDSDADELEPPVFLGGTGDY